MWQQFFICQAPAAHEVQRNFTDLVSLPSTALSSLQSFVTSDAPLYLRLYPSAIAKDDASVSAGVGDFSAPDNTIILPAWMMAAIGAKPGSKIRIDLVDADSLPKADFCRIRAVDGSFLKLPNARAILESEFSAKYRTLTQGVQIAVEYNGQPYALAIEDLEPARSCRLFDTELVVDLQGLTAMESEAEVLEVPYNHSEGMSVTVAPHSSVLLRCQAPSKDNIDVLVTWSEGSDLELYIATDDTQPSPTTFTDTPRDYREDGADLRGLHLSSDNLTICLYNALDTPSDGSVAVVRQKIAPQTQAIEGNIICSNCNEPVPEARIQTHLAFCERHNTRCLVCNQVVAKAKLAEHRHCQLCLDRPVVLSSEALRNKHDRIFHQPRRCDCGVELPLLELQAHKRTACPLRSVCCRYCYLNHPAGEANPSHRDRLAGLTTHESECGSRTEVCSTCGQRVKLKDFEMHSKLHAMAKPSSQAGKPQPRSAAELARLRDAAWARAGFGDDDPSTLEAQSSVPPPTSVDPPKMQTAPDREPTRFCKNAQCVYAVPNDSKLELCPTCLQQVERHAAGPLVPGQPFLAALFKAYHAQLTKGCDNVDCSNPHCRRSATESYSATQAAAGAMKLAQLASTQVYHICVDPTAAKHAAAVSSICDMGFAKHAACQAYYKTGFDLAATITYLLNQAT
eukprot:m.100457 g.100457  ORF g.100457 m.100457 type:complete len:681 (+) comp15126_c0_seq1:19-2061(+)